MIGSLQERQLELASRYPAWRPTTLYGLFEQAAQDHAARDFIVTHDDVWSYSRAAASVARLSEALANLGITNSPVKKVLFLSSSRPSHFSRSG